MLKTFVSYLLDETGSMASLKQPTIDGYNNYLDELTKSENADTILFSLVTFDSNHTNVRHTNTPVAQALRLSSENYRPGASTPLIDAAMKIILATEKRVAAETDVNIVVVIHTDGHENCSTEYSLADLAAKIKTLTAAGWTFTFLGAGIDAFATARQFGISQNNTMSYGRTKENTQATFAAMGANTRAYAASGDAQAMTFKDEQRGAAGDKFWPQAHHDEGSKVTPAEFKALYEQKMPKSNAAEIRGTRPTPMIVDEIEL